MRLRITYLRIKGLRGKMRHETRTDFIISHQQELSLSRRFTNSRYNLHNIIIQIRHGVLPNKEISIHHSQLLHTSFMRKSEFEPNFGFDFEIGSEFGAYKLLRRAKDPFKFNSSSKFDSNSYSQSESSTYGFGFLQ